MTIAHPEYITLVDEQGCPIGRSEKQLAHEKGWLHSAFSIIIVDSMANPRCMLLQKRHPDKYHSGGLWSNACCGHPRPTECLIDAANRRLFQELGFSAQLTPIKPILYNLDVGGGLREHEWNQSFVGQMPMDTPIHANPMELSEWKWSTLDAIREDLAAFPHTYSAWFSWILGNWMRPVG